MRNSTAIDALKTPVNDFYIRSSINLIEELRSLR